MSKSTVNGFGYFYNALLNRKTYRLEFFTFILCVYCFFGGVHCQCSNACFNFYQFKPRDQIERKKGFYMSEERQFNINLRPTIANEQKEIALERSAQVRIGTRGVQGCPLH